MSQITIEESRYQELLKYEAMCKRKAERMSKPKDLILTAVSMLRAADVIFRARNGGNGLRVNIDDIRVIAKEIYTTGGDRARNKAIAEGIRSLENEGLLIREDRHSVTILDPDKIPARPA